MSRDDEQIRRIRRSLLGRGELTREDAEVLQRGRAGIGWLGRSSSARNAVLLAAPLYWAVVLVIRLVAHASFGKLAIPLLFVVLGGPALVVLWLRDRKIQRALNRPPTQI